MATMAKELGRGETINLRASRKQKAMSDRAAECSDKPIGIHAGSGMP